MTRGWQWLAVLGLSVLSAVTYGILHDLVTAHLCLEYFTVAHPPILQTDDPVLLALVWGTIATWWMGFLLGIPLASIATFGQRPPLTFSRVAVRIGWLLLVMAAGALMMGALGYLLASNHIIHLSPTLSDRIPPEQHARFLAAALAHTTSYGMAVLGGIATCVLVWRARGTMLSVPGTES